MPVVEAVGSMSIGDDHEKNGTIEAAMKQAILDCIAEGIPMSDVDTYRARQLAAAEKAKQ